MPSTATSARRAKSSRVCVNSKRWSETKKRVRRAGSGRKRKTKKYMTKKVRIPTPLRKLTNNEEVVEVKAATIGEAIGELQSRYPGIKERLVDEKGEVRRFVLVYVNEEDIRFLQNQQTPLKDGDEISIIPAIAGG